jgi:hypothetical protein
LALDSPMPAWQVAMITRAKHELSAVCLAFLEEIEGIAAGIAAPKQGARPQRSGAKG